MHNKIVVCMWYDDNIKEYADITKIINKKYCKMKNYDFKVSHTKYYKYRHPSWEKINLCLEMLNMDYYDYVFWIDSDACFNFKSTMTLEKIIENNPNKNIIFSLDEKGSKNIHNTGIFLLKNNSYSKEFLKHISNNLKYENNYLNYSWEQDSIDTFYKENILNIKDHSKSIPYGEFQRFPNMHSNKISNELIIHYQKTDKGTRISEFNKILKLI